MSEFVLPNFPTDVLLEIRIFEHWRLGGSFWLPEIKDLYDVASPKRTGLSKQDTSQGGFNGTQLDPILQKRQDPSNTGVRPLHTWQSWGPQLVGSNGRCLGLAGLHTSPSHLAPGSNGCGSHLALAPMERLTPAHSRASSHRHNSGGTSSSSPGSKIALTSSSKLHTTSKHCAP